MKVIKRFISWIFIALASILSVIALYFVFALFLTLIPVNNSFKPAESGVKIFVQSNGVHTDLILPVKTNICDWAQKIDPEDFEINNRPFKYISFGWGDKGFYLNTPTWADLKFSTAFNAMFLGGPSCMHVYYETEKPDLNERSREIKISEEQYKTLVKFIDASFQKDKDSSYILIPGHHYSGTNDNFYEGNGSYYFYKTCNVWTNSGLKEAGVKTAVWAPFDKSVLYHLK
jgi:uncharacterized protein (TIGR02117 family)